MNAAGQALIELLILMTIFMMLIARVVVREIPITMGEATPYLAGQVESRLQTGNGFSASNAKSWDPPLRPKGGVRDP